MIVYDSAHFVDDRTNKEVFVDAIAGTYFPLQVDFQGPDDGKFKGRLASHEFGKAGYSVLETTPVKYDRSHYHCQNDPDDYFLITLVLEGRSRFKQNDREVYCSSGEFFIEDSTQPYDLEYPDNSRLVALKIPRQTLMDRIKVIEDFYAVSFGLENPYARLFIDTLLSLRETAHAIPDFSPQTSFESELRLGEHLIDLLSLVLNSSYGTISQSDRISVNAKLRRLQKTINSNLDDPELSVSFLSDVTGLSPRYLHQIFKNSGTTISKYIRDRRLEECHRALSVPNSSISSLSQLAYRWGFSDQANFNRWFRSKYGQTPGQVRARAQSIDS